MNERKKLYAVRGGKGWGHNVWISADADVLILRDDCFLSGVGEFRPSLRFSSGAICSAMFSRLVTPLKLGEYVELTITI